MNKFERYAMVAVLLVAAVLRMASLPDVPLGLHYDEAANLILTRQIASGDYRPIFIRAYTGKEVLFFYAAAPWVRMTGDRAWGLRLGAAMLGTLTVAVTYTVTRALFRKQEHISWIAILAAAWTAVAFPHLLLSRYGFRAISQPLLQALTVAALWRGMRSQRVGWLGFGGFCLGLTGYTYLAARLFPVPLALGLVWMLLSSPNYARRKRLWQLGIVLLTAMLSFAPLGLTFLREPEIFSTRITQVAAASWREALAGVGRCVLAVAWPGAGDPYIRFNLPGRPLLDPATAVLAVVGLIAILRAKLRAPLSRAGRAFLLALLVTMLLPSALATSEITPSNLRLVGLYPFLSILPAAGIVALIRRISKPRRVYPVALLLVLGVGGATTGRAYHQWGTSSELFYTADGEMVLAAQVLDATNLDGTTVYIASEHYRHPTVAALARQYSHANAKWLTGGQTLVLPPAGNAVVVLPRSLPPPSSWSQILDQTGDIARLPDPDGATAIEVLTLSAKTLTSLRNSVQTKAIAADFAHVAWVYETVAMAPCTVGAPCPILVTWEARAPVDNAQPVLRLTHPQSGEWARTMAFHYPSEIWTVGDIVLDQYTLTPPPGTPPGAGYELQVGLFNPTSGEALPRLAEERFAGLDVRFSAEETGLVLGPMEQTLSPEGAAQICGGQAASTKLRTPGGNQLVGWKALPETLRQGEHLPITLCWQASQGPTSDTTLRIVLHDDHTQPLYAGPPAGGYKFAMWQSGETLEDRYSLRIPRQLAAGSYTVSVSVDAVTLADLGTVEVQAVARTFTVPASAIPIGALFDDSLRLRGYDLAIDDNRQTIELTLYWECVQVLEENYTVFVHVVDAATGALLTQADEQPQGNRYPTSLWIPGEIIKDAHALTLPTEIPPGSYVIQTGLYLQQSGQTLEVNGKYSYPVTEFSLEP